MSQNPHILDLNNSCRIFINLCFKVDFIKFHAVVVEKLKLFCKASKQNFPPHQLIFRNKMTVSQRSSSLIYKKRAFRAILFCQIFNVTFYVFSSSRVRRRIFAQTTLEKWSPKLLLQFQCRHQPLLPCPRSPPRRARPPPRSHVLPDRKSPKCPPTTRSTRR